MGNRMLIVACAVALPLLGGCRASFSRNTVTSRELELKGTRFSAELKKSETIVRFGRFSLRPRVKLCNVSIRVVYDNNDNGIPGDKGDVTEWLSRQSGEFKGWVRDDFEIALRNKVHTAFCIVRGRGCGEKNDRVLATFQLSRSGVAQLPGPKAGPRWPGLAWSAGASRPHYCRVERVDAGTLRLSVGDVAAANPELRELYRRGQSLPKREDFLGAALFVGGHFVRFLGGPGRAVLHLPIKAGSTLSSLRVVSLNRRLEVVGDWSYDDFAM